jgi:hypothetical protein
VGSLRSSAPPPDLGHLDDESLADYLTEVLVAGAECVQEEADEGIEEGKRQDEEQGKHR